MKKLYRSNQDKFLGGVLGGFAEYVNVDPTLVRLGYILLTLIFTIPGIVFYLVCWVIIPKNESLVSHEIVNNVSRETNTPEEKPVSHETEKSSETKLNHVSHETNTETNSSKLI